VWNDLIFMSPAGVCACASDGRSVVEAGVSEEKLVTDADWAGVGVVSAQNGVAVDRLGLCQKPTRSGQGKGGGASGGLKKAATTEHGVTSLTPSAGRLIVMRSWITDSQKLERNPGSRLWEVPPGSDPTLGKPRNLD
jgi:hypothetical protein